MKQIIFLRGVSGSGKTTFASLLSNMNENSIAVCADDYFMKDGKYTYVQEDIGKAHKWCSNEVKVYLKENYYQTVIIHNTSLSNHDVEFYKDIADEYNATFHSIIVENRHSGKNVHNVSDEKLEKQALTLLNNIKVLDGLTYNANKTKPRNYSKLEVIEFLKQYPNLDDGLERLKNEYSISSTKLNGKVLLKYAESSDKNLVIVRECRGLILSEKDLSIISLPFEKFGNYMESYAHNNIDLKTANVISKLDGSCCCLHFDQLNGKWCVQTLGQIEAEKQIPGWGKEKSTLTWSDLFWNTFDTYISEKLSLFKSLDKDYSYIFELCTPYNKVVVRHEKSKLFFLGLRNKKTLLEAKPELSLLYKLFDKPEVFLFSDLKEIKNMCANVLTDQEEGFIVVSNDFKRVKMKSHKYIEEHYSATVQTLNSITGIIFQHEEDEYLSAFPEYTELVKIIKTEINKIGVEIDDLYNDILSKIIDKTDRKEFSTQFNMLPNSFVKSLLFNIFNKKIKTGAESIMYHSTPNWRIYRVKIFLMNSNVKSLIVFNQNNGSIR